jgi:23S rRNA pseudouridine2605 synthase
MRESTRNSGSMRRGGKRLQDNRSPEERRTDRPKKADKWGSPSPANRRPRKTEEGSNEERRSRKPAGEGRESFNRGDKPFKRRESEFGGDRRRSFGNQGESGNQEERRDSRGPRRERPYKSEQSESRPARSGRPSFKRSADGDSRSSASEGRESFNRDNKPFRKRETGFGGDRRRSFGNREESGNQDERREGHRPRREGSYKPEQREDRASRPSRPTYKRNERDEQGRSERTFERKRPPFRKAANLLGDDAELNNSDTSERFVKTTNRSHYSKKKQVEYNKSRFTDDEGKVRLNRYIASTGICSRREADEYIKAGLVMVNGEIVSELGVKVSLDDEVRYNGERLKSERKVYILLNKPKDYVTTTDDPHERRTVMDLIKGACRERVYPVGRLDRMTTGVLLLTNDGDLTTKLTHPKYNKRKIYHVLLDQSLAKADMQKLTDGVELEDGLVNADSVAYEGEDNRKSIGLELHSGKNRVVRRMFEELGYKVLKLDRVYFAGLTKKGLERGHWRLLTEQEISMLKRGAYQ